MHTVFPLWFEITSYAVLGVILLIDLLLVVKRPHVPSMREATAWVVFYVTLALLFAGAIYLVSDGEWATQFIAGWLTEYSLSIDNLFVFILIMARFSVPKRYQQEALMVGIILALIFRGVFIILGAQLIESFSWIFYIFGAFLIVTAVRQATEKGHDEVGEPGRVMQWIKRTLRVADDFDGPKVRTTINGKRYFTPMLLVFLALGATDLLFAIDSIPAIFGITTSPFIVFTANLFALMGLRQLYFLLGGLLEKLVYLKYGIAAILGFIGVKLVFHAMHVNELSFINGGKPFEWAPEIDTMTSLLVIVAAMAIATIASLIKVRIDSRAEEPAAIERDDA